MLRPFRLLVATLLAVAVPFQGALAVGAAQCMASHHHDAGDGHDSRAAHDGHEHPGKPHGKSAGSHCGPCAGCCASAAIAAPIRVVVAVAAHDPVRALPASPPPGTLPSRLDRPPLAV